VTDYPNPELMTGGFYGLAMNYNTSASAFAGFNRLWQHPSLQLIGDQDPPSSDPQSPAVYQQNGKVLFGNSQEVPFRTVLTNFSSGSAWLELLFPVAAIGRLYPIGGFPFENSEPYRKWRSEIDAWFVSLATYVFGAAPFQLALIGFEIDIADIDLDAILRTGIPKSRVEGFLLIEGAKLIWYPPTAPIFSGPLLREKK
jgi:hypothetical protein